MRKVTSTITETEIEKFLERYIKVYDATFLSSGVTDTEIRYLIEFILLYRKGIPVGSTKAIRIIAEKFRSKETSVRVFRTRLKNKGWLLQTTKRVELIPALKSEFDKVLWNVTIEYESVRESESRTQKHEALQGTEVHHNEARG